nr:response regulator transcription factor [Butyrivibrio sp.]
MRRNKKRSTDKQILLQYFLTYFIVLFIPLVICCSYYVRMLSVISEDDIREKKTELIHNATLVDDFMEELDSFSGMLAGLPAVNIFRFQDKVLEFPNTNEVKNLQDKLFNPTRINSSVYGYYIFFDKSRTVINDSIAYDYKDFYNLYLRREEDLSFEAWDEYLTTQLVKGVSRAQKYRCKDERSIELLAYSCPLPNNGYDTSSGYVRIFFEENVLASLMPVPEKEGLQYILNDSGDIIYCRFADSPSENAYGLVLQAESSLLDELCQGGNIDTADTDGILKLSVLLDGKKYIALRYGSPSGYTYCSLLPVVQFNARQTTSMISLTVFILLAAAVGLGLCWHMSARSATPLTKLLKESLNITHKKEEQGSAYSGLNDVFQYLGNVNSDLIEMMEEQKPYIRTTIVNRLLFGNPLSQGEYDWLERRLGFEYRGKVFTVLIFRVTFLEGDEQNSVDLQNTYILSLIEIIQKVLPECLYAVTGEAQVSVILSTSIQQRDMVTSIAGEKILQIRNELPGDLADRMLVYGGTTVDRVEDIYESYHNAVFTFMNEKGQIANHIIWYQNNKGKMAAAFPYFELSVRLTRLVTSGDEQGLHDALKEIMTEYIFENNLPAWLEQVLLNELQAILFRIIVGLELEESETQKYYCELEKNHQSPILEQITNTLGLYRRLCAHVNEMKDMEAGKMMPAIVAFIDANYGDQDLSLTMVADKFGISVPYLSSLFKTSAGVNFSSYVENVRIEKAKGLLKNTSMTVGQISQATGYGSSNSFCRAFKRVTDISASEYRRD